MKYSIGIDYGTQSVRAVLLEIGSGKIKAYAELGYRNGVLDKELPTGEILGIDWAIQVGNDYYLVLVECIKNLLERSIVNPELIIGIGIDATSCTMLPLDSKFEPLSESEVFRRNPHSYVKMWKHHAAQSYANLLNQIAGQENMPFLKRYGGKNK
jgi:L-ribulokinase